MIYTFGCSFTKWYWPTWSDWLEAYSGQSIQNLAYPGHTNEHIYYQLLTQGNTLTANDTVYIAWGANHRASEWYDREWIDQKDVLGFFPDTQGQLWHSGNSYQGLWKCHPEYQPSITEMIINNWDIIFKTQLLLNSIGCNYRMMFCQNPWMDTREQHVPAYRPSWDGKGRISTVEIERARSIMTLAPVTQLLELIDWSKILNQPTDRSDPATYTGIWDFMLSCKEYVVLNHDTDSHPNTLVHHDWIVKMLDFEPKLQDHAYSIANQAKSMEIPVWTAEACVAGATTSLNRWILP